MELGRTVEAEFAERKIMYRKCSRRFFRLCPQNDYGGIIGAKVVNQYRVFFCEVLIRSLNYRVTARLAGRCMNLQSIKLNEADPRLGLQEASQVGIHCDLLDLDQRRDVGSSF